MRTRTEGILGDSVGFFGPYHAECGVEVGRSPGAVRIDTLRQTEWTKKNNQTNSKRWTETRRESIQDAGDGVKVYVWYSGVRFRARRRRHLNGEDEVVEVQIAEKWLVVGVQLGQGRSLDQVVFVHLEDVIFFHGEHRYRLQSNPFRLVSISSIIQFSEIKRERGIRLAFIVSRSVSRSGSSSLIIMDSVGLSDEDVVLLDRKKLLRSGAVAMMTGPCDGVLDGVTGNSTLGCDPNDDDVKELLPHMEEWLVSSSTSPSLLRPKPLRVGIGSPIGEWMYRLQRIEIKKKKHQHRSRRYPSLVEGPQRIPEEHFDEAEQLWFTEAKWRKRKQAKMPIEWWIMDVANLLTSSWSNSGSSLMGVCTNEWLCTSLLSLIRISSRSNRIDGSYSPDDPSSAPLGAVVIIGPKWSVNSRIKRQINR